MMKCPKCGGLGGVELYDTRTYDNYNLRKRVCFACGARFRTVELYEKDYKRQVEQEKKHRQVVRFVNGAKRRFANEQGK